MTQRWGTLVVPINDSNHDFWYGFKETCRIRGVPYTRAFRQAAELWLRELDQPLVQVPSPAVPFTPDVPKSAPESPEATEDTHALPPFNPWI